MRRQRVRAVPEEAVEMKTAPGYFVTRDGRIYSTKSGMPILLRTTVNNLGYQKISIRRETGKRLESVHRLVALAFVANPDGKPEVNHKDLDKLNNWDTNLEWTTRKENLAHARAVLGWWAKGRKPWVSLVAFPVWPERDALNAGKILRFSCATEAAEKLGKKRTTFAPVICRAMKNQWKAYGYFWRRAK